MAAVESDDGRPAIEDFGKADQLSLVIGQNERRHRLADCWRASSGLGLPEASREFVDRIGIPRLVRARRFGDDTQPIG
jgi:hypothetical protein